MAMVDGRKFRLVAMILGPLIVASCAMPAFNLQLILAHEARGKMTEVATVSDVNASHGEISSTDELFYVPSRMTTPDHGLLVRRHSLGYDARYVLYDSAEKGYRSDYYRDWQFFNDEPENQYPVILPGIDGLGNLTDLYFVAMPERNETDMVYATYLYDETIPSFDGTLTRMLEVDAVALALDITGQGAFPQLRILYPSTTPSEIGIEAEQFIDSQTSSLTRTNEGFVTLPDGAEPADGRLAYQFSTDTYVYSFTTGGESFAAYSWVGTGTPRKLDSDRRIDEILENGDLYSRGGSTDVIYDSDGKLKHELKVGALYFSHERIDPSGPVLVYSLVHRAAVDEERVSIGVYEIALSDVDSLE